ncbi:MAG: anaerobic ribonucleoside-triphosphate reductase activating protein [Methanobacteriaceae archaeon]|jgi:pyruvate formate lyase activating enzyme|nr:anaerobic ribonucleoside-triphosphate reductase activating protein [Methanobacteriaceae archaeon]OPY19704.1 MAG: pyruvate formate lyase-activating enzyme 1 [Methanobacterium sp. PtaU1.Bin097]
MIIGGMLISSVEYPGKISLVLFTGGCILRCPYCHNPELISGGEEVDLDEIKLKIQDSLNFIDSLVITGGEPLVQFEDLKELLNYLKDTELKIKLDTNGCYPERLEEIIHLVDYVALDVKAPANKYEEITGASIWDDVKKSMEIVRKSPNTFLECRTTYVPGLLDKGDIQEIVKDTKCDLYTIQQFRNRVVLDEKLKNTPSPSRDELLEIAREIKSSIPRVKIKTGEFGEEIIE